MTFPPILLGCGTFGGIGSIPELIGTGLDRHAAFATLDEAVALGIDVFDTAAGYADGQSERVIGEWLRSRPVEVTRRVPGANHGFQVDYRAALYHKEAAEDGWRQMLGWFEKHI
jgi:predicted aldo/keto reductase-like oxidoreductase